MDGAINSYLTLKYLQTIHVNVAIYNYPTSNN